MTLFKRSATILLVLFAVFSHCVFSHTYLSSVFLDNKALDEGDCVRPHPQYAFDSPIPLVTQADMTCGFLPAAANPANRKCPISAGSKIGLQWHHNSNSPSDDIVDPTHKGPVIVYMAKSDTGAGSVWFKIYEDGFVNGAWGVDRMIANKGRVDITIPSDIPSGNYLLRGEIIALHGSYALNGAQPYVGCVELSVSGGGSASPATVAIPGAYKATDPGILLSIYYGFTSYIIPGPAVYKAGSSGSNPNPNPTTKPVQPTTKPVEPTTKPVQPTTKPVEPSTGSIKVQANAGNNVWWFALSVTGGSEDTVKVELKDAGSVSSFSVLSLASFGYYFSKSVQVTMPITVRLTSASGQQVVLDNIFTSITDFSVKDTGKDYATTPAPQPTVPAQPTQRPTTAPDTRPTNAPTTAPKPTKGPKPTKAPTPTTKPANPTNPPSNGESVKVNLHSGTTAWWLALSVSGVDNSQVASVEIKDSNRFPAFTRVTDPTWGGYFTFSPNGVALVAPFDIRVTSKSGKSVTATFNSFGGSVDTYSSL